MMVDVVLSLLGAVMPVFSRTRLTMSSMEDPTRAKMSLRFRIAESAFVTWIKEKPTSLISTVMELHVLTVSIGGEKNHCTFLHLSGVCGFAGVLQIRQDILFMQVMICTDK